MPFAIKWRSLRTRIVAWSFVPTAIVLLAVAYVAFYAYQRAAEDLVVQRNQELARLSAGQLSTGLTEYTNLLQQVAQPLSLATSDPVARRAVLQEFASRMVVFDGGVVYLDSFGTVRDAMPERKDILGEDLSARPYFREMFHSRKTVFSDVLNDGADGAQVVAIAVPVTGLHGEFQGALAGMFRLDATAVSAFYGGILRLRLNDTGNIYLVDRQGRVVYHPDHTMVGKDVSAKPEVQQLLASGAGSRRAQDVTGAEIVASFAPIPGTAWGLVSEETRDALMAPTAGYRRFLIFLLILGLVAPAIFVAFGVRQITRPIADLTSAAEQVADGHFDHQITTGTADELEVLAAQFNLMATRLQESYANLERRVEGRTRELRTLNRISAVVNASLEMDEILESALKEVVATMGEDTAAIGYQLLESHPDRPDEQGPYLKLISYLGISDRTSRLASHLLFSDSAASESVQTQRPAVKNVMAYPESELKNTIGSECVTTVISVPLIAKNRVLGVINLGLRAPRVILSEELSLLASIGQLVGMAMENCRLYEKAEEMAATAERGRLARDLHDAVTQTLFSASLIAEVLPKLWERSPDEGHRRLAELRQLTRGALAEMRTLLLELRPSALTDAMLGDLLKQLGESVTGRARVPVTVNIESQCPLPADVQVAIYRIAQEALNNVAKHSAASQAWVRYRGQPDCVSLAISDDGRGFDPEAVGADHLGLGIMRERAETIHAQLTVDSEPGSGTTIEVDWHSPDKV